MSTIVRSFRTLIPAIGATFALALPSAAAASTPAPAPAGAPAPWMVAPGVLPAAIPAFPTPASLIASVTALLGGTTLAPAPTATALGATLQSAIVALQNATPAQLHDALAGLFGSALAGHAVVQDPSAVQAQMLALVAALEARDAQRATTALVALVDNLTGVNAPPADVQAAVQGVVAALLAGNPGAALDALGRAFAGAVAAARSERAVGDATGQLPAAVTPSVGPVIGAGAPRYWIVANGHRAGAGRLVVLGAREVRHGKRVRVGVGCVGTPGERCRGSVTIKRAQRVLARSSALRLRVGEKRKFVLRMRRH